jgi:catechol 2,3-dioxygenase-like lactoylglutathione lyase family enzyme
VVHGRIADHRSDENSQVGWWHTLGARASSSCPLLNWKIPRNLLGYLGVHGAFAMLNSVTPFFIVDDLGATLAFYQSKLGFDIRFKGGGDGDGDDFWAILGRDRVMLIFKAITPEVHPQPNRSRHEWARWDAYIYTDDPDSLYGEFVGNGVPVLRELANTSDGLRAFEITDNNGYLLCFGRPVDK